MFSIEALEGQQGAHRYFSAALTWGEIAQLAVFPEDLADELDDDQEMQRSLARKRINDLVDYLREDDHFFSALTFVLLPHDLNVPIEETTDFLFESTATQFGGRFGTLQLSGSVRLFPADGQHRARAGIQALRSNKTLLKECVPVVLVPYRNVDQVRQLFADLNLNAKPVNKTIGYAFDSRDPIALVAKQVADRIPLFQGRVNRRTNSLARRSANVVTLNALVEGTRSILSAVAARSGLGEAGDYVSTHGPEAAIEQATHAWTIVVSSFPQWRQVEEGIVTPGDLREHFIFPHGLGWLALSSLLARLLATEDEWANLFRDTVSEVDWRRNSPELNGIAVLGGRISNTRSNSNATMEHALQIAQRLKARSLAIA